MKTDRDFLIDPNEKFVNPISPEPTTPEMVRFMMTDNPLVESDAVKAQKAEYLGNVYLDLLKRAQEPTDPNRPDEQNRAEACYFSSALTGTEDAYGTLWRKGGFKTGADYLSYMKDFFLKSPDQNKTQRLKDFEALDEAGQEQLAIDEQKWTLENLSHIGGNAFGYLRDRVTPNTTHRASAAEKAEANYDLRDAAYRRKVRADYYAKLLAENAWIEISSILPQLSKDGRECTEALMASKKNALPESMYAKFNNLPDEEKKLIVRARTVLKPNVEGGFWNAVGDMGVGFANIASSVVTAPWRFGNKLGTMANDDVFDTNELAKRRNYLWEATGDFFAGGDLASGALPQLQFEQLCEDHGVVADALIGAVTTVPYMLAAAVPGIGFATVAMEAMNEMDDHVVMEGGDITDQDYVLSSFIFGGLYAYAERLQVDRLIGDVGDIAFRQALLKGFARGIAKAPTVKKLTVGTLSESVQEGLQNGIMSVNEAFALDRDATTAFADGFVKDFVGSLGTMAVVEMGGMVSGHWKRSGYANPFTAAGREAGREARSLDLEQVYRKYQCMDRMVDYEARSRECKQMLGSDELYRMLNIWEKGGKEALVQAGIGEVRAEEFDYFFSSAVKGDQIDEETGEVSPDIRRQRAEAALRQYIEEQSKKTVQEGQDADIDGFKATVENLDWARTAWARGQGVYHQDADGKVVDPGAKALEQLGFAPESARRLSTYFHAERAAAYSQHALDGIRSRYERATRGKVTARAALANEFKGRVVLLPNGTDANGKTTYGDFIRFKMKNGGDAYVQIVETPTGAPDFQKRDENVAKSIAAELTRRGVAFKESDWLDATPEEREKIWKKHKLFDEGYFTPDPTVSLVVDGDPSARVDSDQAKRLVFGTITLANYNDLNNLDDFRLEGLRDSSVGFHEAYHAWEYFMRATGQWTENEEKALAEKYGKDASGRHNEENAADAMRGYVSRRIEGRMTEEDEKSPFSKMWSLAQKLIRRGKEQASQERVAANSEAAFFDQIVADRYAGVTSLDGEKKKAPEPKQEPKPSGTPSPEPAKPSATPEPAKPSEPAKPTATPKPTESKFKTGWTATTPLGEVRVGGRYMVLKLSDVIHSNDPRYAAHKELQPRNRKDNKKEEQKRENIINNLDASRFFDGKDTANGEPIVALLPTGEKNADGTDKIGAFVISGNGRVIILNQLLEKHLYDKYRNELKKWCAENGVELDLSDGEERVLVRVIDDLGGKSLKKIAKLSNADSITRMTESEYAGIDAETIVDNNLAPLYHANVNGTPDMTPGVNDDFFRLFSQLAEDGDDIYDEGNGVTENGKGRIVRAMLNIACGQGGRGKDTVRKLIKDADTLNIVKQRNAAQFMAPAVAALESNPDYQIGPDISAAVADYMDYVEKRNAGKVGTFEEYLGEDDMFAPRSVIASEVLKLLGSKQSASDIAEYVKKYCEVAKLSDANGSLGGEANKRSREDVWNEAKKAVEEARNADGGAAKHSISSSAALSQIGVAGSEDVRHSIAGTDFTAVAKYYDGDVHSIARRLKTKDPDALKLAAAAMARAVPKGAVLVPVPSHDGRADDTYALANEIATLTGSPVVEALRGEVRPSVYEQKASGYLPTAAELGFRPYDPLPEGREVIFIDNVVGTGTTAVAAHDALGQGRVLAFAWDHTAPRPIGIVGALEGAKHSFSSTPDVEKALDGFAARKGIKSKKRRADLNKTVDDFETFARRYRLKYVDAVLNGRWKDVLDYAEQNNRPIASNVLKEYFSDPQFKAQDLVGIRIEDSADVAAILMTVRSPFVESIKAIYLDKDKKILDAKILSIGQPNSTYVGKGAVTREMPEGSKFVVLSHNHPSGHPKPSPEDVNMTKFFQSELDASGVQLLDHIITDGNRYYSFNEKSEFEVDTETPKWEMYPAGMEGIPTFSSQDEVESYIAAHLRDDGDSGHIIYLNTQMDIVGIKRIPMGLAAINGGDSLNKWLDKAVEGVTKTGAVGVFVDLGPVSMNEKAVKELAREVGKRFDTLGVRVQDILAGADDSMDSWIEYAGPHNQDKPEMREFPKYSFAAGEVGSANMRNALFLSSYLDQARQMLGKRDWQKIPRAERLAIKAATGWEKGADGKWRLEIMDLPEIDKSKLSKPNPDYADMTLNESNGDAAKSAKYLPVKLGALWSKKDQKSIDLFDAYPWIRDVKIVAGAKFSSDSVKGSFNDDAMTIFLNDSILDDPSKVREVVTHELQHVIQHIEDFARGGNRSVARKLFLKRYKEAEATALELYREQGRLTSEMLDNRGPYSRWYFYNWPKRSMEYQRVLHFLQERWEWQDFERRAAEFKKKYGHQFAYFTDGDWGADIKAFKNQYKDYTKLAGEVEARNASKRTFSPFTLLEDTEDTERRYQKLIDGNMEEFKRITEAQEELEKHSFAGMRGANAAGVNSIDDAEVMERRGDDRETIFRLTGWYRGADGFWRVELPFHGRFVFEGDFDSGIVKGYRTVSDYFDWPELFQAYPELRDVEVRFEDMPEGVRGDFDPKTKTIRIANAVRRGGSGILARHRVAPVMVHEIQHAIQSIENHSRGGSPEDLLAWDHTKVRDEIRRLELAREIASTQGEKDELTEMIEEHELNLESDREAAEDRYYRLAGEVEARNAANRFYHSPSWRLKHPPWETEEVERENQLLDFSEDDEVHWDNVENGPLHSFAARLETVRDEVRAQGGDIYLAYHGTQRGGFTSFDRAENDAGQTGFYFAKSKETAMTYSSPAKYDMYDDDGGFDPLSMVTDNALYNENGIYNVALKIMKPLVVECGGNYWNKIPDPFGANGVTTTREVTRQALEGGQYDAVIFKEVVDYGPGYLPTPATDVYVVRDPEQIKVVDDVTYDDEGNIIPDEERLDWSSPDIRHSIASAWGENFPDVTLATTLASVHKDEELARLHKEAKAGNLNSALALVDRLFPNDPKKETEKLRIARIKQLAADHPNAWIVPVRAVESAGDNMLPFAYAIKIRDLTGLSIDYDISQTAKANHTGADGLHRFLSRAAFGGHVRRGREYIMIDDHVTQGGTLAALRKHIVNRGGKVVAAATLTASQGSSILSPRDAILQKLITKFGEDFPALLKKAGVADGLAELSQSEAAYLLKFSPDRVRDTLVEASVNVNREKAHRHGPGYAGLVRSRSEGIGRLGEVSPLDGRVRGDAERGTEVSPGVLRRPGSGRSATSDVIPGFDEYVDPATGKMGETRFAKAPLFRGYISKELNAVIDEADQSKATGEDALRQLNKLIERSKATPEGKIVIARYREGNSYNGTSTETNDPKRQSIWAAIVKELLDDPITSKNNEGLEIKKKTGKPKNAETIDATNAAHPDLPKISNDENARFMPSCDRRLDIVVGPPAAGKSSVFVDRLSIFHRARVLDSDAIKKRLPGFDKGNGASFVHEESSALNKLIIKELLDRNLGENVVLPIVGSKASKVVDYIEKFRSRGYTVYLHNNYVPILHAFGRSLRRTMSSGRWIDPSVFTDCMDAPSVVFEELKDTVDFWDEFDNDGPRYADPLYVRGNYVDPAYGQIVRKPESAPKLGKNGLWTNAMLDPQLMLDFAQEMDAEEGRKPFFDPRPRQGVFNFGSGTEGQAMHSIRSGIAEGGASAASDALVNWLTYFRLSHGSIPKASTISRMGLAMGMSVVDAKRILKESEKLSERMRGTIVETAARNGDVATAVALIRQESSGKTVGELIAGAVSKGGELSHKGVGQINRIIGKRVEQMMRDFTAATLADMEGETGLDIAAEILEQNPDAFNDEIKPTKGTDPDKPTEDASDADAQEGAAGADGEQPLTDLERFRREQARQEALKKIEEFIAKAKARADENRAKAEERRQRAAQRAADGGSGDGNGDGGNADSDDMEQALSKAMGDTNPKNVKANFKTKEEFAAFIRVWAEYKFNQTHGRSTLARAEKDRLFAEFYRITVRKELQDLADKLLAPKDENGVTISRIAKLGNGARNAVSRMIGRIEKGVRPDTIERMSANIFAFINSAAIRVSRADLVKEFKKTVKERYIQGALYEELKLDSDRRVTGWVEEAARYICRVCDLSKRGINGDLSQLAKERQELLEIINRRADVYDESGKDVARAAREDMMTKKAMWKLALLDKYGAMTSLMPGEILDLQKSAFDYLDNQAADLESRWAEARAAEDSIRRRLTSGIVAPKGQRYQPKGIFNGRLFDALNGLLRLRLRHLTRFADDATRKDADEAVNEIIVRLGDGETAYNRMLQEDRRAFYDALAQIFSKNGRFDRAAAKKYLDRMTQPIPIELSEKISNQGFVGTMTYGQMLQLLVSLEQKSFAEAVEHNGRQGQADLIRSFVSTDAKGRSFNVFSSEDNQFVEWLRSFYEAKRALISPVTMRMVGQQVDSPDPLYCPVKRLMDDRVQALAEAGSSWDPIAAVFSRRVRNNRDFDEQASILGMFFDRSNETAKLIAWAERGTLIRGIFTNVGIQSAIRRAFGTGELRKIMSQLLATFNGGESKSKTPGELAAVDKALNFATYAYLGFNPLSGLKQTTSFTVWANALPGGFKDLWKYMTHFDAKVVRHLKESDEYKVRYGNEIGSGQDMATKGLNENPSMNPVARMLSGAGMWMLKKADFAPGCWIAQGLYKDYLDKHMQEGMSFAEADRRAITETFNLLEETQQSGRTYNTNMLTIEHGRIGRLLTQFATSPLQQLQYETQAWREWRDMVRYEQGDKKIAEARHRFIRAAVINHLLIPAALNFVTAVFKAIMGEEPPWEKDGYHWALLTEVLLGQFSRVFFVGVFAQTSLKALFSREYPRVGQILPVEGLLGMAASLGITAHDVIALDAEKVRSDIERLLKSTAPTRIPYNIYRRIVGDSDQDRKKKKQRKPRR